MTTVPDGYCEMQFLYSNGLGAGGGMWTLGWQTGGVTDSDEDENIVAAWEPLVNEQLCGSATWNTLRLVFGTANPSAPIVRDVPAGVDFASVPALTYNTAYLVQKRSNQGGRANRGRMYLPGCAEAQVDDAGNFSPGARDNLQTALEDAIAGTTAAFLNGGAPGSQGAILHADPNTTPTLIQSYSVTAKVATQRKRLSPI